MSVRQQRIIKGERADGWVWEEIAPGEFGWVPFKSPHEITNKILINEPITNKILISEPINERKNENGP